ncbi:hypothetical protein CAPTEDRAFT_212296, partial [Capitella teleta]
SSMSVIYKLRNRSGPLIGAWRKHFAQFGDRVQVGKMQKQGSMLHLKFQVSEGDIFEGAPAADAIVSPANSFGFMDGGIDMVYSRHFGWQMQTRLQEVIRRDYAGEILVGQAAVIPTYADPREVKLEPTQNEGKLIKWLISAPTMRVPLEVPVSVNAFLAFRAVIIAVQKHNEDESKEKISSVLCPGLATAVGRMPAERCAFQMFEAFRIHDLKDNEEYMQAKSLSAPWDHHMMMEEYKEDGSEEM